MSNSKKVKLDQCGSNVNNVNCETVNGKENMARDENDLRARVGKNDFEADEYLMSGSINHCLFNRFQVVSVVKSNRTLLLELCHIPSEDVYYCELSGIWFNSSNIFEGCIVNIKSDKFVDRKFYVDNIHGLISIDPDILITSTLLSSSVFCMRKAWLSDKFKGYSVGSNTSGNKYMLIGTIIHDIFQTACSQQVKSYHQLKSIVNKALRNPFIVIECVAANITESDLIKDIESYLPSILKWIQLYVHSSNALDDESLRLQILSIRDIEDNIWCPSLGLKGKIDLTCQVEIHLNPPKKVNMPLELKTGRASFSNEHSGQVSLYSMMMNERENGCDAGLLLYIKDEPRMRLNRIKRPVSMALLQQRNQLAYHLEQPFTGPETKDSQYLCSKCDHLFDCCLMLHSFEPEQLQSSRLFRETFLPLKLAHLNCLEKDFFKHWFYLSTLEAEKAGVRSVDNAFWSVHSTVRETMGFGLSNLVIKATQDQSIIFERNPIIQHEAPTLTTFCGNLFGERVAISIDEKCDYVPTKIAIFVGYVTFMDSSTLQVSVDRLIRNNDLNSQTFRLDMIRDHYASTINRDNILNLMQDFDSSSRLRRLIICREAPKYSEITTNKLREMANPVIEKMNILQQTAVLEALKTEDFLLIRGSPGSGKTVLIANMIRLLTSMKKSVLITSHTHAAVDNILCKLIEHEIDFVRFGDDSRIHSLIKEYSVYAKTKEITSSSQLRNFYNQIHVAAVTCMGIRSDPIFNLKTFDYCIVDEATQILLPTNLGPLFCSKRFILVGDEKQLPPVVQSSTAKEKGFNESLFTTLLQTSPSIQLSIQYRMNEEILSIPSKLFYQNTLKCGSEIVAKAVMPLPHPKEENEEDEEKVEILKESWINKALSNELEKSFIFINTDACYDENEKENYEKIDNEMEACLCLQLVMRLINKYRISAKDIGLISPYQKQVTLLRRKINCDSIFINTVDQFQGKEKMIIIISLVKCKADYLFKPSENEILNDERRLNVALTRAARKLILIGSKSTLTLYDPFQRMFNLMREDQFLTLSTSDFKVNQ